MSDYVIANDLGRVTRYNEARANRTGLVAGELAGVEQLQAAFEDMWRIGGVTDSSVELGKIDAQAAAGASLIALAALEDKFFATFVDRVPDASRSELVAIEVLRDVLADIRMAVVGCITCKMIDDFIHN
jgi:hypothetical protein